MVVLKLLRYTQPTCLWPLAMKLCLVQTCQSHSALRVVQSYQSRLDAGRTTVIQVQYVTKTSTILVSIFLDEQLREQLTPD